MRIYKTGAEFDELGVHRIVYTCCIAFIVGAGTLQRASLIEIVKSYIISIVCSATTEVYIVILTDPGLKNFIESISIGVVHETIVTRACILAVASGQGRT